MFYKDTEHGGLTSKEVEVIQQLSGDFNCFMRWAAGYKKPFKAIVRDAIMVPGDWGMTDEEVDKLIEERNRRSEKRTPSVMEQRI